jgi:hypothetical protein
MDNKDLVSEHRYYMISIYQNKISSNAEQQTKRVGMIGYGLEIQNM